jgi:hypothetical protein
LERDGLAHAPSRTGAFVFWCGDGKSKAIAEKQNLNLDTIHARRERVRAWATADALTARQPDGNNGRAKKSTANEVLEQPPVPYFQKTVCGLERNERMVTQSVLNRH